MAPAGGACAAAEALSLVGTFGSAAHTAAVACAALAAAARHVHLLLCMEAEATEDLPGDCSSGRCLGNSLPLRLIRPAGSGRVALPDWALEQELQGQAWAAACLVEVEQEAAYALG